MSNMQAITLSPFHKSFPPAAWGSTLDEFVAERPTRAEFATPLLTLDRGALTHNTATMFAWLRDNGLKIAPHGKTTMSPRLWAELADAGAWGLTLATAWQAQVGRQAGVRRIMIANSEVDPVGLRWLSEELDGNDDVEIFCWADRADTVALMESILRAIGPRRRVPVIAELGAPGGRTGARTTAEARDLAQLIHDSDVLELAGVGGYEGSLAHSREEDELTRVDAYLDNIAELHASVLDAGAYRPGFRPIVTAGGSAYFDRVAARLGSLAGEADVVLRSGAFQIHDDGFYASVTPMGSLVGTEPFRSAMHAWVRVVSHPEPGLVLFDAGKRDLPFDEGLPVPQRIVGADRSESDRVLAHSRVTRLNDQHGFLSVDIDPEEAERALPIGTVIRLGLSHPCTTFDKWRLIPIVDSADADDPVIIDAVETHF